MDKSMILTLVKESLDARGSAYAPYSKFAVGAALLTEDGQIFKGCNIENASYGATICAERTAFVKAISEGHLKFKAIAICGGTEGAEPDNYAYPCGICRQFMTEFCNEDFEVYICKSTEDIKPYTLKDLMPEVFVL